MRKKSKHIGVWVLLMSVGDESVDILFIMGNDSESLPDELVCNSDHSEFTGFSVLPKPSIYVSPHLALNRLAFHAAT